MRGFTETDMSKSTISTFQLFELFPDEDSARVYLEGRLWPNGTICPTCKARDRITPRKAGYYRCNACQLDFTIRTGTIFERSHVPLHNSLLFRVHRLTDPPEGVKQKEKSVSPYQPSSQ